MTEQNNKISAFNATGPVDNTDNPLFDGLEEEGDYEEPDRDTDYTSIYREDGIEDEDFADTLFEEEDEPDADEVDLWGTVSAEVEFDEAGAVEASDDPVTAQPGLDREELLATPARQEWQDDPVAAQSAASPQDDEGYWEEDDEDDYEEPMQEAEPPTWPWGLIAVAVIALVLLMAGGYGVIEQRSETQEEIRRLQAALATSVTPDEVTQTREALAESVQRNDQLQTTVDALNLENRRLSDTVTGLEAQMQAQREALGQTQPPTTESAGPTAGTNPESGPEPVTPAAPKSEPTPAPELSADPEPVQQAPAAPGPATATAADGNGWFVNFASYGVEATAASWVDRLKPSAGRAVMTTGTKNGRTFYRVRVVDLPNRESADKVAVELAAEHRLPKLWVGRKQ